MTSPAKGTSLGSDCSPTTVAALFVEENGVYANLPGVEVWGISRDARKYAGPHPVVAHPPCQLWVNFAALNYKRYGGEHNRPGNDGGCFASALASVRKWGGVLEHPASSNAWQAHGLRRPVGCGWLPDSRVDGAMASWDGWSWVCEVWQSAYGHPARKRTWLYCVTPAPPPLDWSRQTGSHQIGWFDRIKPTLSKKAASATPPAFRDLLLSIARSATMAEEKSKPKQTASAEGSKIPVGPSNVGAGT